MYKYEENFPELPDWDGKGKKARQAAEMRKKIELQDSLGKSHHKKGNNRFRTNFAQEIA